MGSARTSAALLLVVSTGCGQYGLRKHYKEAIRPAMLQGDFAGAATQMEAAKDSVYGEKDRVMYWLNLGALQHYAGEYKASDENLVKAEEAMQELWTTSISAEASKVLLNETAQSYPGEDFEKVLVYFYTSLNHAEAGQLQDAQVEARRADELLKKMQIHSEKEGETGTIYTQDAFMLWLVGLYREMEGDSDAISDAYLAYKAAYEAYNNDYARMFGDPAPPWLPEDLYRTATLSGNETEAAMWQSEGATGQTMQYLQSGMGELILFHSNGESPFKQEYRFNAPMPDGYIMSVAVPEFVAIPHQIAYAKMDASGQDSTSVVAEPITQIVLENFKHKRPGIHARAVARAIAKYAITKGLEGAADSGKDKKKRGKSVAASLVGIAANIAAVASEAADLRSWTVLPANIGVARMWLPPGKHMVEISFHSSSGAQIGRLERRAVEIKAAKRTLLSLRTIQ